MIPDTTSSRFISLVATTIMMIAVVSSSLYIFRQLFLQQPVQPETYGMWYFGPAGHIMNVENGPDEEPLYYGEALPGTSNDYPGWRIYKYEFVIDPTTRDTLSGTIRYAGGSIAFDKVWDNRAEYEYS